MIYIDDNGKLNLSNLHDNQRKFIESKHLHTGIVGGYQSGKSTVAMIKVIVHLLMYPGVPIAYYLPTYGLFEDMLVPKLCGDKESGRLGLLDLCGLKIVCLNLVLFGWKLSCTLNWIDYDDDDEC